MQDQSPNKLKAMRHGELDVVQQLMVTESSRRPITEDSRRLVMENVITENNEIVAELFHKLDSEEPYIVDRLNNPHANVAIKPLWLNPVETNKVTQTLYEVDTGAGCDILPLTLFESMFLEEKPDTTRRKVNEFKKVPVEVLGSRDVMLRLEGKEMLCPLVVDHDRPFTLGRETAIRINYVAWPQVQGPKLDIPAIRREPLSLNKISNLEKEKTAKVSENGKTVTHHY